MSVDKLLTWNFSHPFFTYDLFFILPIDDFVILNIFSGPSRSRTSPFLPVLVNDRMASNTRDKT